MKSLNKLYKEKFNNQFWINSFFRKNIKKFFPGNPRLVEIKIIKQKAGFSLKEKGYFLKYKILFLKNKKKEEIEAYLKRAEIKEYENLKQLQKFDLLIPKPLGYFPEVKAMLYIGVRGDSLNELMEKGDVHAKIFKNIAKSLSRLHQIKIKKIEHYSIKSWVKKNREILTAFKKYYPFGLKRVEEALRRILPLRKILKKNFLELTHGDFTPSNIIIAKKNKIGIIDFSKTKFDNPLVDAGIFLAQIDSCKFRFNLSERLIRGWQNLFKKYYLELNKNYFQEDKENINIYQAWEEIHNAHIFIKGNEKDKMAAEEMIIHAMELLDKNNPAE